MLLTIGQIAEQAGVNVQTLRYYERRGILIPAARRDSGYRLYTPDVVQLVRFLKGAQQLGFSLEELQALLDLRASTKPQCARVASKAEEALHGIESRITQLDSMCRSLKLLVRACDQGKTQERCPILDAFDAGEEG